MLKKAAMKKLSLGICLTLLLSSHAWARDANTLKEQADVNTVNIEVLAKTSSSWDGSNLPDYSKGKAEVTILRITIPPKVRLPLHKHPVINAGVLLKGELTVVAEDNQTLHLKAGDSIVELVDRWHYGINEGSEPAEIIVFYAGIHGTPITVTQHGDNH